MFRIIKEVKPRFVFAENVTKDAISTAAEDLYGAGYSCRFMCLSAADLGAPHSRNRYWLGADSNPNSEPRHPVYVETPGPSTLPIMEWWRDDTEAMGVSDGIPSGLDQPGASDRERLQGLGNAQIPACAVTAWNILSAGFTGL